ncbi:3-oxoacyl-[acyl-carrier-protein] reductase FabG-like [Bradysia coprophila]|uniref:3-oxoacyl-[acyl-carrier-protein] reductase FabG-like n=1 Tax=Bradysia coprophila TaxID=38358 RepID=UPI00187D76F1|nr:3-oxoacyl-[acyl-carrier-protein] reductase FabG-like [Bradysia coprophila]
MSFAGKVILITGASSGIGAACAEYFAKEGAQLALVDRNADKFQNVVQKIKQIDASNDPLVMLKDVTMEAKQIIDETIRKYNRLDVLINNAGFSIRGTVENTKIDDFDSIFATNVRAVFMLTQLAIPYLIVSKGNVVNMSSAASLRAMKNNLAYSMAKASVDHFTRCAALELASKGVRVNSVNPALIITDFHLNLGMTMEEYREYVDTFGKQHPVGRAGQPEEVVRAVAFLSAESSGFVTGISLPIDGGITVSNAISATGPRNLPN